MTKKLSQTQFDVDENEQDPETGFSLNTSH